MYGKNFRRADYRASFLFSSIPKQYRYFAKISLCKINKYSIEHKINVNVFLAIRYIIELASTSHAEKTELSTEILFIYINTARVLGSQDVREGDRERQRGEGKRHTDREGGVRETGGGADIENLTLRHHAAIRSVTCPVNGPTSILTPLSLLIAKRCFYTILALYDCPSPGDSVREFAVREKHVFFENPTAMVMVMYIQAKCKKTRWRNPNNTTLLVGKCRRQKHDKRSRVQCKVCTSYYRLVLS